MKTWLHGMRFWTSIALLCVCGLSVAACRATQTTDEPPQGRPMPTSQPVDRSGGFISVARAERLEESNGQHGPLSYGDAVAIHGDVLAVGAPERLGMQGRQEGRVFIYRREGDAWVALGELHAWDRTEPGQTDQHFGSALALSEDTLIVGAPGADDPEAGVDTGAVYVFQRRDGVWKQDEILVASQPAPDAGFGDALALNGDVLAVSGGYSGHAVYVFERQGEVWLETGHVTDESLGERDRYGFRLAVDGDRLATSVMLYDPELERYVSSAVQVYERQGGGWAREADITADDPPPRFLGSSLDLEGDILVVGVGGDEAGYASGSVHIYQHGLSGWTLQERLVAGDGTFSAGFGSSVDLEGDLLAVGAGGDPSRGLWTGSAYLFRREGTAWVDVLKLWPDDVDYVGGFFGADIRIFEDTVAVAAPDEFGNAVYVFDLRADPDSVLEK